MAKCPCHVCVELWLLLSCRQAELQSRLRVSKETRGGGQVHLLGCEPGAWCGSWGAVSSLTRASSLGFRRAGCNDYSNDEKLSLHPARGPYRIDLKEPTDDLERWDWAQRGKGTFPGKHSE